MCIANLGSGPCGKVRTAPGTRPIGTAYRGNLHMFSFLKSGRSAGRSALAAAAFAAALSVQPATAQETIKVGILHSLSGTMAISETTLKDVMLMLIDDQNK